MADPLKLAPSRYPVPYPSSDTYGPAGHREFDKYLLAAAKDHPADVCGPNEKQECLVRPSSRPERRGNAPLPSGAGFSSTSPHGVGSLRKTDPAEYGVSCGIRISQPGVGAPNVTGTFVHQAATAWIKYPSTMPPPYLKFFDFTLSTHISNPPALSKATTDPGTPGDIRHMLSIGPFPSGAKGPVVVDARAAWRIQGTKVICPAHAGGSKFVHIP